MMSRLMRRLGCAVPSMVFACNAAAEEVPERLHCAVSEVQLRAQSDAARRLPGSVVRGATFFVELPDGELSGGPFSRVANVPALMQSFEHRDKYSIAVELDERTGMLELARVSLPSGWSFVARFEGWHVLGECEGGPA